MERADPMEDEEPVTGLHTLVDSTIDIEDVAFGVRVLIFDLFRRRDRKREDALILDELGEAVDISRRPEWAGHDLVATSEVLVVLRRHCLFERNIGLGHRRFLDREIDHHRVTRVDPVRVLDVRVPLPDLRPQERVPQIVVSKIPQRVTLDDGVHHGAFWKRRRRIVRRPVIVDKMQRLRRWSHRLRRSHQGKEYGNDGEQILSAHKPSPR